MRVGELSTTGNVDAVPLNPPASWRERVEVILQRPPHRIEAAIAKECWLPFLALMHETAVLRGMSETTKRVISKRIAVVTKKAGQSAI